MGVRGVICFFAIFFLLITATKAAPEVKKRTRLLLWNDQNDSRQINDDTADLLWRHCRLALFHAMEVVEDLHMQGQEFRGSDEFIPESDPFSKENIHKIVDSLHPLVKQTVFDCLRKNNLAFLVTGEDIDSQKWYTKYLKLFYMRSQIPRRSLDQSSAEAPAPSPSFSPQPSPAPAPAISGTQNLQPASPPSKPFFLPDLNNPTSQTSDTTNLNSSTGVPSNEQKSNHKTVVVAVVVTAAVTLLVAALMFLCYCRFCGPGSRAGQNDERPLLSLSLSDYSLGNSINVKPGDQSLYAHSNSNKMAASVNGKFSMEPEKQITSNIDTHLATDGAIANYSIEDSAKVLPSQLKLPPGRLGPSGQPPLKPPPGRTDHLEPPLQGKGPPVPPHPGKGPPPPPVQPSSMKTPGSPRPPPPGAPLPPPIPSGNKSGPRPPLPPSSSVPPPRPPAFGLKPPVPSPPSTKAASEGVGADAPKAKLKPFFWDKVLANPDHSMVWHQIKSGSFQFNEEMIETLFGYAPPEKNKNNQKKESSSQDAATQYIQIIDPKKSQNLSILLKALNVTTEEVSDAIEEGNELSPELLQTLLKMAPTTDEELKLRLYSGELSRLGPADRFLKILVDIPFAFKRLESLLFMSTLQEEVSMIKESFATLEAACTELRKSRLFLKLLEAVLKTGNRMNDGTFRGGAQAFKLDTLLKLSDVKGVDGKTTLLHFVVREIIRSEGKRAERTAKESQSMPNITSGDVLGDSSQDLEEHYCSLGLQVVSSLDDELENVKKAAIIDADSLTGNVAKLGHALVKSRDFLKSDMKNLDEENRFHQTLKSFVQNAEVDVMWLLEEEKRIMALVKSTADYFHGNSAKDEGSRLFGIVRDFLILLGKTCKEVKDAPRKPNRMLKNEDSTVKSSSAPRQSPSPDPRQRLFPAIAERRVDSSSSDDEAS